VKVKGPHFRRPKCLDSVALDILNVRRDLHRSAKDFAIFFVNLTSFEPRKLSRRGNSLRRAPSAVGNALELILLIADEHWSRRY